MFSPGIGVQVASPGLDQYRAAGGIEPPGDALGPEPLGGLPTRTAQLHLLQTCGHGSTIARRVPIDGSGYRLWSRVITGAS